MGLPTYTNIWRIEKRLYKLYDFRLPAPLPITWIVFLPGSRIRMWFSWLRLDCRLTTTWYGYMCYPPDCSPG